MGTIFSVFRRKSDKGSVQLEDFLQKGDNQVASLFNLWFFNLLFILQEMGLMALFDPGIVYSFITSQYEDT